MTDALKPCPFCGGTRLSDECTGAAEISGNTYQTGWIECFDCGCDGPSVDLTDETPAQNDYQLVRDAWNCRAAAAPPVAPDMVLIPRWLVEAASDSLGSFVSDHGWAQQDMDNMDSLDAYLASQPAAPGAPDAPPVAPAQMPVAWHCPHDPDSATAFFWRRISNGVCPNCGKKLVPVYLSAPGAPDAQNKGAA